MTRPFLVALALGACTSSPLDPPAPPAPPGPMTGPGDMELAENTGGSCDDQSPWCGYDLLFDSAELTVTSRSGPATGTGTLTPAGIAELDDLIAAVPYDAPNDESTDCLDVPLIRLHVTFDEVGARTFDHCKPGVLAPLGGFVERIANAVINYTRDPAVIVDAPF